MGSLIIFVRPSVTTTIQHWNLIHAKFYFYSWTFFCIYLRIDYVELSLSHFGTLSHKSFFRTWAIFGVPERKWSDSIRNLNSFSFNFCHYDLAQIGKNFETSFLFHKKFQFSNGYRQHKKILGLKWTYSSGLILIQTNSFVGKQKIYLFKGKINWIFRQ